METTTISFKCMPLKLIIFQAIRLRWLEAVDGETFVFEWTTFLMKHSCIRNEPNGREVHATRASPSPTFIPEHYVCNLQIDWKAMLEWNESRQKNGIKTMTGMWKRIKNHAFLIYDRIKCFREANGNVRGIGGEWMCGFACWCIAWISCNFRKRPVVRLICIFRLFACFFLFFFVPAEMNEMNEMNGWLQTHQPMMGAMTQNLTTITVNLIICSLFECLRRRRRRRQCGWGIFCGNCRW